MTMRDIPSKAQIKRIIEDELRKRDAYFFKIIEKLRKRTLKLEEKTKNFKIKLPNKNI